MATMFRERIFYTWLILDLLTLRSEVHGEKAPCPLSIRPQRVVLEYGQSINVECRSSEES
ncbi:hypothetical protein PDJAM_G00137970, partial [Pangasius djambal]|nr:hypothetical protein [Pangasius djambal]